MTSCLDKDEPSTREISLTHPISDSEPNRDSQATPPGMPRWVKISAIVAVVLMVLLVVIMALAGGEHGPGLHTGLGTDRPSVGSR